MKSIAFTDGSSRGNPGPGGWGTIIIKGDRITEYGGRLESTTNNRMELTAFIEAVKHGGDELKVYADSAYVINGFTTWMHDWKKKGWINTAKQEVMNQDLWKELDRVASEKKIDLVRIKGHRGIPGNERCDVIATSFAAGKIPELYSGSLKAYQLKDILDVSSDSDPKTSGRKGAAYSYVSAIGGVVEIHKTWKECEARVKGKSGARYKKALSKHDEALIVKEFSSV